MTLATVDRYEPDRTSTLGDRAVVIGGSMAGLCAARVLADTFAEVVVLERDRLPTEPVGRTGAPQTSHPHALLEAGRATLEDLFPGFGEDLLTDGGLLIDSGTDMEYYDQGGLVADTEAWLPTYCASRPLFEHVVRRQLRQIENVRIQDNSQVLEYRTDDDATAVTGVDFRNEDGDERTLDATLTVDATGRTSRTPQWLDNHGYKAPPVDEVQVDVTYSTIQVERPPEDRRVLFVPPSPPRTRGGAVIPVEGDRWEVIIQGIHGDDAPTDPDGFVRFVESLPVPALGRLVDQQSWVTDDIDHYPYPSSRRHRYETLDRFPDGLVVTGDAIASFNPIYGQGMSVAALDAVVLHEALTCGGVDDVAGRFFERSAEFIDVVWQIAVGADFAFPQTTGPKPTGTDVSNWYLARLLRQAQTDPTLSEAFLRVLRLEEPPATLLRPNIAWRVLRPTVDQVRLPSLGRSVKG